TLHPAPYTLHPAPCTLHPTPCTLHPTPYTLVVGKGGLRPPEALHTPPLHTPPLTLPCCMTAVSLLSHPVSS
ncbi:hypothetical protein T484DRAFT_1619566, partial [Baffinella frigidus]